MLERFWDDIPVGKENAATYAVLCGLWKCTERTARAILHKLSSYDNGDNYILIRSSGCKGFYKTDNEDEINAYKRECINKGRSVFAPIKKINRVLALDDPQCSFANNLRVVRESRGMKQEEVCNQMKKYCNSFDKPLLSKMENSVILPTPFQLSLLAQIYGIEPRDILDINFHY